MSASWCKQPKEPENRPAEPATSAQTAGASWRSAWNTDVRELLHRMCYAMCTPRPWYPDAQDDGSVLPYGAPPLVGGLRGQAWPEGHSLGKSVFWDHAMAWGRGMSHGGVPSLTLMDLDDAE